MNPSAMAILNPSAAVILFFQPVILFFQSVILNPSPAVILNGVKDLAFWAQDRLREGTRIALFKV